MGGTISGKARLRLRTSRCGAKAAAARMMLTMRAPDQRWRPDHRRRHRCCSRGGRLACSYAERRSPLVHGIGELLAGAALEALRRRDRNAAGDAGAAPGRGASESALTGVKVSHVLRGGAGEQAGLARGDELLAAGGWRLRLCSCTLRALAAKGETTSRRRAGSAAADCGWTLAGNEAGAVQLEGGRRRRRAGTLLQRRGMQFRG